MAHLRQIETVKLLEGAAPSAPCSRRAPLPGGDSAPPSSRMANFRSSRDGPQAQTETSEDFLPAMGTATGVQ
jgi:hypothetical protein